VDATSAALLGTLVGAVTALGVVLTSLVAWRNERSRQQAAKDAADVEILRQHTAVAFTEMFAINHAPTGSHGSPSTPRAR
jgi:hypothetical protein